MRTSVSQSSGRAAPLYDSLDHSSRGEGEKDGRARQPLDPTRELLEAFDHSARVSEYLTTVLPKCVWHAKPPGGEGRSIAAIVAHMQSVRRTFAKMGGAEPAALDRTRCTPAQARQALEQSREVLRGLFG